MQLLMAYTILVVLGFSLLLIIWRPQVALTLFLGMYATEQILIANIPYFSHNTEIYNYIVGIIGVLAITIATLKKGLPSIEMATLLLFFSFICLTTLSLFWTHAPNAGKSAVIHFACEAVLGFLLPFFLLRKEEDINIVVWMALVFALITSLYLILMPISGSGGRVLLVKGGSVLSPATFVGSTIILLAGMGRSSLKIFYNFKYIIMVILMAGCYIGGARTQFFGSSVIALVVILAGSGQNKLVLPCMISGLLLYGLITFYLPESFVESTLNAADRYRAESFESGFQERLNMVGSVLNNDKVLVGHGVMGWAFWVSGKDTYLYPHNSLAQVYFELGVVGLILFLILVGRALFRGFSLYRLSKRSRNNQLLSASLFGFVLFSFILSLKQGTYMSCINLYIGISLISVYYKISKRYIKANINS